MLILSGEFQGLIFSSSRPIRIWRRGWEYLPGLAQTKFGIIIFALSSLLSAHMGEEILFGGALLAGYRTTILVYIFLILVIFLGASPLSFSQAF